MQIEDNNRKLGSFFCLVFFFFFFFFFLFFFLSPTETVGNVLRGIVINEDTKI